MVQEEASAAPTPAVDSTVPAIVQEILSAIPGGCTWLVPVFDEPGQAVDFLVAAAGGQGRDIYGRGATRVHGLLSELYPSMVDGPLWRLYQSVLATGEPGQLDDFRYEEKQAGIIAEALFDVSVHRVLDGLLVWWQRLDEDQRRLARTEHLGRLGWAEYVLATGVSDWSPGMYRIFERDPALGPMSLAEQGAALLPDDRDLSETAWQTLDTGTASDITVRFTFHDKVKYLRILSDIARDADGTPLKIYAVVQDVTAREDSRSEIERLSDQLRKREITALAEHRLAGQLQNMIQPIPAEPFSLTGLDAAVTYLPAESAVQVGGDWYHAQTLSDDHVVLAIGDVAGHGLESASGMAYLRYALFAWLSIGIRDPGTLLGHLNQLCTQLGLTGSAVVAVYDPTSRTMSFARAGHPPPLLGRAGVAEPLTQPVGLLLGAQPDTSYEASDVRLQADDLVLFYTDGLVERRGAGPLALLEQVLATIGEVSAHPDEQMVVRIRDLLSDPSPYDDTCTLAVRVRP